MSLPPLPNPVQHIMSDGICIGYTSEAQTKAYGQACREHALEEALKERDALTAKVASFESRIDRHVKTELALIVNNKSLKDAARLALEAFEVATTPLAKDRQEISKAIAALKAVL